MPLARREFFAQRDCIFCMKVMFTYIMRVSVSVKFIELVGYPASGVQYTPLHQQGQVLQEKCYLNFSVNKINGPTINKIFYKIIFFLNLNSPHPKKDPKPCSCQHNKNIFLESSLLDKKSVKN